MIEISRPTSADVEHIITHLCAADTAEVWASHRHTPKQAVESSVGVSDYVSVARHDGVPIGVYGLVVRDILMGEGVPWMLTTDGMRNAGRELLTITPRGIDQMFRVCARLSNYVYVENKMSIRWLRRLGFTMEPPVPVGVGGEMFHEFHMTKVD